MLERTAAAADLYDLLAPYAMLTAVAIPEIAIGPVGRPLGLLATLLGRFDDAETHFDEALRISARLGARPALAHTQCDYARMLARRDGDGDLAQARELAERAVTGYRALEMDAYEAEAAALVAGLAVGAPR